jgi:hypothetical protein
MKTWIAFMLGLLIGLGVWVGHPRVIMNPPDIRYIAPSPDGTIHSMSKSQIKQLREVTENAAYFCNDCSEMILCYAGHECK